MLYATTTGDGPLALLALHGGLGWDHTTLRPWLDPLAEHARLTYLDLLGCGRSPEPEDWDDVTHATWADSVDQARQSLAAADGGHRRVVLFGHSYGAVIALETARRHPEGVAGLVLCAGLSTGAHLPAALGRAHAAATTPATERALAALGTVPQTDDEFRAGMPAALPLYAADPEAGGLGAAMERVRYRAAPLRRSLFDLVGAYDARPWLAKIDVPALVLSGRHDWLAPPDESPADLLAGLTDAEGHVFEHSGHFPFVEESDALVAVVADWLDRRGDALVGP